MRKLSSQVLVMSHSPAGTCVNPYRDDSRVLVFAPGGNFLLSWILRFIKACFFFFPRYAPFTLFVVFHTPYKPTDSTYYPVTTMIYSVTLSAANGTGVKIQEPGMFKRLTRITKPTEAAHEAEQDSFQLSLLLECLPLDQKE